MTDSNKQTFTEMQESGEDFGDFYPVGHLFVAFPGVDDAKAVRDDLLGQGVAPQDCRYFSDRAVRDGTQKGIDSASVFSMVGATLKIVGLHNELAAQGCHFLLIATADDAATERAMAAVRRRPFKLAQKYKRLVIEEMV